MLGASKNSSIYMCTLPRGFFNLVYHTALLMFDLNSCWYHVYQQVIVSNLNLSKYMQFSRKYIRDKSTGPKGYNIHHFESNSQHTIVQI